MAKKKDDAQKKEEKKGRQGRRFSVSKEAKRRLIPPFVMLTAGAAASILMVTQGRYELHEFLKCLLLILLLFYILGCLLKGALDIIDRQNTPPEPEEDEMIEKGPEEAEPEAEADAEASGKQAVGDE